MLSSATKPRLAGGLGQRWRPCGDRPDARGLRRGRQPSGPLWGWTERGRETTAGTSSRRRRRQGSARRSETHVEGAEAAMWCPVRAGDQKVETNETRTLAAPPDDNTPTAPAPPPGPTSGLPLRDCLICRGP